MSKISQAKRSSNYVKKHHTLPQLAGIKAVKESFTASMKQKYQLNSKKPNHPLMDMTHRKTNSLFYLWVFKSNNGWELIVDSKLKKHQKTIATIMQEMAIPIQMKGSAELSLKAKKNFQATFKTFLKKLDQNL